MPKVNYESADTGASMTSDEWCSPADVATPLFQFWGVAGCDPCTNDRSLIKAHVRYTWGGLQRPWCRPNMIGKGDTCYQNHPYSTNEPWADKAVHEMRVGNVGELVILCMTATSTEWWRKLAIKPRRNPRIICTKRLKFVGPDGKAVDSSRFEPAMFYYGKRAEAFDRAFRHVAKWSTWGR